MNFPIVYLSKPMYIYPIKIYFFICIYIYIGIKDKKVVDNKYIINFLTKLS